MHRMKNLYIGNEMMIITGICPQLLEKFFFSSFSIGITVTIIWYTSFTSFSRGITVAIIWSTSFTRIFLTWLQWLNGCTKNVEAYNAVCLQITNRESYFPSTCTSNDAFKAWVKGNPKQRNCFQYKHVFYFQFQNMMRGNGLFRILFRLWGMKCNLHVFFK